MFHKYKIFQFISDARFAAVLLCSLFLSFGASAQFAATPCDPNYYQSLEARAWLEAQREITQNQNLIFKPDSVLEYTCFDNHLREVANHAQQMFSESTRWGSVLPANHMDNSLEALVSSALNAYDTANFPAALLGGRVQGTGGWAPVTPPSERSGPRYDFESSINAGTAYACDIMQAVWQKAKCLNFASIPANDGFFSFEEYETGGDKRWPSGCADPGGDYTSNLAEALPPVGTSTPWAKDPVVTYYDRFFPTSGCGSSTNNRIRTGLVVEDNTRSGQPPAYYNEHICLVPGCYWEPTGLGGTTPTSPTSSGSCTDS